MDKAAGLSAYTRLRTDMKRRGAFDLLLHLQLSIRASATAACIPAPIKLGFDKPRARELQWLFTNRRIAERSREHVLDSFLGFADALGVPRIEPRWDIPLPPAALAYAEQLIPSTTKDAQPTLVISAFRPFPGANRDHQLLRPLVLRPCPGVVPSGDHPRYLAAD